MSEQRFHKRKGFIQECLNRNDLVTLMNGLKSTFLA